MDNQPLFFLDGTFEELANELAGYIDNVRKGDDKTTVAAEIAPLIEAQKKDDALKVLVTASSALNAAPEKEFSAAYNLLLYLVNQSPSVNMFLRKVCENLSRPITSSPAHGPGLALFELSVLFNMLKPENEVRFNVFQSILRVAKNSGMYESVKPQLSSLDTWIQQWDLDEEEQRKLFNLVSEIADDAGEEADAYDYMLRSLRTFDANDASEYGSPEAQSLALRALKSSILSNTRYDFNDLKSIPAVQALSDSHPIYSELLDIFAEKELEDYKDFLDEHDGFIEKEELDAEKLHRKMRLLTLPSLAASTSTRELEYKHIAKALQIPLEDVEKWVIDVIRVGLVEGKLSQQKQKFLIHGITYRVFGQKQWREVGTRVDGWIDNIKQVLSTVRAQRQAAEEQKMREMHEVERKMAGLSGMGGGRRDGKGNNSRSDGMVEMGTD